MKTLSLLVVLLPSIAFGQITCAVFGTSVVCDYPDGSSRTATELRSGQGVVSDSHGGMEPYTILPAPSRSGGVQPLRPLEPLPTVPSTQSGLGLSPIMPGLDPLVPSIMLGE